MKKIKRTERIERVRAIIIVSEKILLINRIKDNETYWVIPGGRVEAGESHGEALERECVEELGVKIHANGLFMQQPSGKPGIEGQQEFFYLCNIIGGKVGSGQGPEFKQGTQYKGEYIITWVDFKNLSTIDLRPKDLKDRIIKEYLSNKR